MSLILELKNILIKKKMIKETKSPHFRPVFMVTGKKVRNHSEIKIGKI